MSVFSGSGYFSRVAQVRSLTEQLSQSGTLILSSKSRRVIYPLTVRSKSKTKLNSNILHENIIFSKCFLENCWFFQL